MYKLITTIPEKDADRIREVLAVAGAGKIGNYTHCTFSVKGVGRFKPETGANPLIGEIGNIEAIVEEKIETTICEADLKRVIEALKAAHPYEEPIIDVYKLSDV